MKGSHRLAMSSLPTPTPGPPPPPDASSPTRQSVAILAVVLGLVGGLCVLSIIIVFYRTRCKKSPSPTTDEAIAEALSTLRGRTISTSHPAARMVPFESRQHPQFRGSRLLFLLSPHLSSPRRIHSRLRNARRRPPARWRVGLYPTRTNPRAKCLQSQPCSRILPRVLFPKLPATRMHSDFEGTR